MITATAIIAIDPMVASNMIYMPELISVTRNTAD